MSNKKNNANFDRTFISQNSQFFAIIPHNFLLQNREKLCQKHRLQKMLMAHQVLKS